MSQLTAYDKFLQQALKYGFSLYGLPATGQTVSYAAGDDGDHRAGYPRTGARWVDNNDGTVTDLATGVTYMADFGNTGMTWEQALNFAAALTLAGYSDWRLANAFELFVLYDFTTGYPVVNTTFFKNTGSTFYHTSTTPTLTPLYIVALGLWEGGLSLKYKTALLGSVYVRGGITR